MFQYTATPQHSSSSLRLVVLAYARKDESDSGEDGSSDLRVPERASRRFFSKKRRNYSGEVSSQSTEKQSEGGGPLRRRMSQVMTRRSRTAPTHSLESSEGPDGDHTAASAAAGNVVIEASNTPGEMEVGTNGVVGIDGPEEAGLAAPEKAEEEPPPFTMALAVTLTGLRLILVDQVIVYLLVGHHIDALRLGVPEEAPSYLSSGVHCPEMLRSLRIARLSLSTAVDELGECLL